MKEKIAKKVSSLVCAVTACAMMLVAPVHADTSLSAEADNGLVGHWSLDDGTAIALGETYAENVYDADAAYWGSSKLYTASGRTLYDADGMIGKAFKAAGYTYIKTDSVPTSVLDANKEMTISLWLKTPSTIKSDNQYWVFGIGPENSDNAIGYNLNCDGKEGLVWRIPQWQEKGLGGGYASGSKDGLKLTMLTPDQVQADTWYHVALKLKYGVSEDKSSDNVMYECYLNGEKIDDLCSSLNWYAPITSFFNNASTDGSSDNYVMTIGAGVRGGGPAASNFVGCVDDVRVYNKADSVDIAEIYGMPSKEALIGHWKLDDNNAGQPVGTTYTDSTENSDYWGRSVISQPSGYSGEVSISEAVGMDGKAFRQNGYSYIKTDTIPREQLDSNKQMTLSLWVKTPDSLKSSDDWVFGIGPQKTGSNISYNLLCDNKNGLAWKLKQWKSGNGGGYEYAQDKNIQLLAPAAVQPNTWYHVAIKLEYGGIRASDNQPVYVTYDCYLNGTSVVSGKNDWQAHVKSFFYNDNNYILAIGAGVAFGDAASTNFRGCVDDVRIYNKTNIIDISSIYSSTNNYEADRFCAYQVNKDSTTNKISSIVVKNTKNSIIEGNIIAAVYDDSGEQQEVATAEISAESNLFTTVVFENPVTLAEGQTLKIFVWKDLLSCIPTSFEVYAD